MKWFLHGAPTMTDYLRYTDDLEVPELGETQTIRAISLLMKDGQHTVRKKYGESVRISHAKAHGIVRGVMEVLPNLPPELAQGLFAESGLHDVLMRLSQAPGEVLDDRRVSSIRGLAMKIFDARGTKVEGHEGANTQDFVMDTGRVFVNASLKAFLANFSVNVEVAPRLPEAVKGAVSKISAAANQVLHSPKIDTYGHPTRQPLAEAYYTQIAYRYGDYVAKIALVPTHQSDEEIPLEAENAVRDAVVERLRSRSVEFELKVQLATDPDRMPIEDPTVEWSEDESPFRTVARITLEPQNAWDPKLQSIVDRELSFSPAHALEAHRPLGRFGRARMQVYRELADLRRKENGRRTREPLSVEEVLAAAQRMPAKALARVPQASFVRRHPLLTALAALGLVTIAVHTLRQV